MFLKRVDEDVPAVTELEFEFVEDDLAVDEPAAYRLELLI
jgi:hypothetical protein